MKILILANDAVGLYQFRKELLAELLKNNEVVISLPKGNFIEDLISEGCRFIDTPVDRRGINPVTDLKLFNTYRKFLKSENPDLVITYTVKPNAYGGMACRLCRVPYAANITGLGTAFQGNGMLRKFVAFLYKAAFKKAKIVFFENENNRDTVVNAGIIEQRRTHVLHGAGVNLEHYQVLEYPEDGRETRFLFMGRVMREKGMDELFAAMRKLTADKIPCHLDILGGFDEDYSRQIRKYEAEGWLTYHGYQSDVRPAIRNCHCFVLPSWHEGMANTNLECAASGRPVITSNIHGCLEAVEEGVSGYLVERQNVDSLYEAMKTFTELPYEKRKAMGLAGRRRMEEVFDKRKVVEETIKELMRQ